MIVDAFLYHGEESALSIRLHEHFADVFVLAEGDYTLQGQRKYPTFTRYMQGAYNASIDHVIIPLGPIRHRYETPMDREKFQRRWLSDYLFRNYPPDASLLFSDADEIVPFREIVSDDDRPHQIVIPNRFYWTVDWLLPEVPYHAHPFVCHIRDLEDVNAQQYRRGLVDMGDPITGGWEFSFLGPPRFAAWKLQSFGHFELNRPEVVDLDRLEACIREGRDPFPERDLKLIPVEVDANWPAFVRQNPDWVHKRKLSRHDWEKK